MTRIWLWEALRITDLFIPLNYTKNPPLATRKPRNQRDKKKYNYRCTTSVSIKK